MAFMDTVAALGELRRSDDEVDDVVELRRRLEEDGYLFLPGYHDRAEVLSARHEVVDALAARGVLARDGDRLVPGEKAGGGLFSEVAAASRSLTRLLYTGPRMELFERFFGEPVRHFDHTWLRAVTRGHGTPPHLDAVFMNRGTPRLLTAWTPLGDIDTQLGGVAILGRSHQLHEVTDVYSGLDVDSHCADDAGATDDSSPAAPTWRGELSDEALAMCDSSGLEWLTADYRAGDLLVFPIVTTHAGLGNVTDEVRLSCDSRYQRASETVDPRWVGPAPAGHGDASKVARIC